MHNYPISLLKKLNNLKTKFILKQITIGNGDKDGKDFRWRWVKSKTVNEQFQTNIVNYERPHSHQKIAKKLNLPR